MYVCMYVCVCSMYTHYVGVLQDQHHALYIYTHTYIYIHTFRFDDDISEYCGLFVGYIQELVEVFVLLPVQFFGIHAVDGLGDVFLYIPCNDNSFGE